MTRFVLVHGSGQNASSWDRVAAQLRGSGHTVLTPELPKHARDWTLKDHARRIAAEVTGIDTIVAAHSLCGALLPLVAAMRPCRLVFVAAVVPEPGVSIRQQFQQDPGMFTPAWQQVGRRFADPDELQRLGREFLFHDCAAADLPWALSTLEPMATDDLVIEPSPFAVWPPVPTGAIVAALDRTLTADWCRRAAARANAAPIVGLDSGHCPHMTRADDVAAILGGFAGLAA